MIQAELRGKLPSLDDREDILTSNVFGLLKYLPPHKGIFKMLERAKDYSGNRKSFIENLKSRNIDLGNYDDVEYFFWEDSPKYGEPDVILIIRSSGRDCSDLMLCIEVKYQSKKSDTGEKDQLKCYTIALADKERRKTFRNPKISNFSGIFLGTVYLTHFSQFREVRDSIEQIRKTVVSEFESKLFELRWNDVAKTLAQLESENKYENTIASDLVSLLRRKNLIDFAGFSDVNFDVRYVPLFYPPLKIKKSAEPIFKGFSEPVLPGSLKLDRQIFLGRKM